MKQSMWFQSLPYASDSTSLFTHLVGQTGAVLLDSGSRRQTNAHYDIFSARPSKLIYSKDGITVVESIDGQCQKHQSDPFEVLRAQLAFHTIDCDIDLPFYTGAIGYFGYDLGHRIEKMPRRIADCDDLPEMMLGIYDWSVVIDHNRRQTFLVARPSDYFSKEDFNQLAELLSAPPPEIEGAICTRLGDLNSNMDKDSYIERFNAVKDYIYAGDCYQINLAQRFVTEIACNPWQVYLRLRELNSAPFSAYLDFGQFQVLSISPEKFLNVRSRHAETSPIKGTRPRALDATKDSEQIEDLANSAKDCAENLMIVDLLRNDLGKSCRPGSIAADRLFDIESFDNVHHLVSTVSGDLADDKDVLDLLRGCFPGGSITGAPKLRAMEIIEELEPHRRGVYCGSIGYLGHNGDAMLNIAIRTTVYKNQHLIFYGGGGIVADSDADSEYQEIRDKVSSMMDLLKGLAT